MTEQSVESPPDDNPVDPNKPTDVGGTSVELPEGEIVFQEDDSGDGITDFVVQKMTDGALVAVSDGNGDLRADTVGVDMDGSGAFDVIVTRQDGNYHIQADLDGDGVLESELDMTREELLAAEPQIVALLDVQFGEGAAPAEPSPEHQEVPGVDSPLVVDGELVGDPTGDSEHWFQQAANGFCVPASIAQIVSEYSGVPFESEAEFVERANELKVFEVGPDGVPSMGIEGALTLLEDAGVPATIEVGQGMDTLVDYLAEGRRVMVAVDSDELWYGEHEEKDENADHAIVVTRVDVDRGVVIVSDTGHPEGNAKEYPISQFQGAWADSGYTALVCDVPPDGKSALPADVQVAEPALVTPAAAVTPGSPGSPELPDLADASTSPLDLAQDDPSTVDSVVGWTISHAWVMLPVLLGARAVAGARR